jgi:hypothetical protein
MDKNPLDERTAEDRFYLNANFTAIAEAIYQNLPDVRTTRYYRPKPASKGTHAIYLTNKIIAQLDVLQQENP